MDDLRRTLRQDLTGAMKARDKVAVAALRSALGAIENAEAVPTAAGPTGAGPTGGGHGGDHGSDYGGDHGGDHYAGAAIGVGAAEAERRVLTDTDLRDILSAEVNDRTASAEEYTRLGRPDQAGQLRAEAEVLSRYLA